MAYRIVAKSPEKLDDILTDIKEWFTSTKDYVAKLDTEKRKFADPATKQIVSKDIDIIYVKDMTTKKETKIMLIPLLKPGEMKVEIGGENEHVMKGKIKNMMKGRGDFKSYNKDTLRKMEAVETLRNMIREEISNILKEGTLKTITLYALRESEDGRFHGTQPTVYIEANSLQKAKQLADEYTNGQFKSYPGFYDLQKSSIQIYR